MRWLIRHAADRRNWRVVEVVSTEEEAQAVIDAGPRTGMWEITRVSDERVRIEHLRNRAKGTA